MMLISAHSGSRSAGGGAVCHDAPPPPATWVSPSSAPAPGGRRDVLPRRAAITRDVDQPVVRAGPEDAALVRRLAEGEDRAIVLRAGVVAADWPAGGLEFAGIVARQVGADHLPALPLVGR